MKDPVTLLDLNDINNEDLSVSQFVKIIKSWSYDLKKKIKFVFIISLFGASIGLIYASLNEKKYIATLTFALDDDKSSTSLSGGIGGAIGLASQFGVDLGTNGGGAFTGANLIELMKSRKLVEKTLLSTIQINNSKTTLCDYYIKVSGLKKKWEKTPNIAKIEFPYFVNRKYFSREQDSVLKTIFETIVEKNLIVSQKDKKISIITLRVTHTDELFSKLLCENLATETSKLYTEIKSKKAKMNVDVLQSQADSVRLVLNNSISEMANASDKVYNVNPAFNIYSTQTKKKQVDVQANTAILTQLLGNLEIAKVTLRKETPLIQIIDTPILPLEIDKISKLISVLICGSLTFFLAIFYLFIKQLIISFKSE